MHRWVARKSSQEHPVREWDRTGKAEKGQARAPQRRLQPDPPGEPGELSQTAAHICPQWPRAAESLGTCVLSQVQARGLREPEVCAQGQSQEFERHRNSKAGREQEPCVEG